LPEKSRFNSKWISYKGVSDQNGTPSCLDDNSDTSVWVKHEVSAGIYRLQNEETGFYLKYDNGNMIMSNTPDSNCDMVFEQDVDFFRIRVGVTTDEYLHIQDNDGSLQVGTIFESWWSSRWTETVVSTGVDIPFGESDHVLIVGGVNRTIRVTVPQSYNNSVQNQLILLCGWTGSRLGDMTNLFRSQADVFGTVMVDLAYDAPHWDVVGDSDTDAMIAAINFVKTNLNIKPNVAALGASGGARCICKLLSHTNQVTAVAPIVGTIKQDHHDWLHKVAVLCIHGGLDDTNGYDGLGLNASFDVPVKESLKRIVESNAKVGATAPEQGIVEYRYHEPPKVIHWYKPDGEHSGWSTWWLTIKSDIFQFLIDNV